MQDETRPLRIAQANLIALQSARIALLEARLEVAVRTIARQEAEIKRLEIQRIVGVKTEVQA